jgi:hypothetical protein
LRVEIVQNKTGLVADARFCKAPVNELLHGYRFIAAVLEAKIPAQEGIIANLESSKMVAPEESVVPAARRERRDPLRSWTWVASLGSLLVVVLAIGLYWIRLGARSQPASENRIMLAGAALRQPEQ